MASEMKYGICPQCGYINFYVNPSKFPICESCGYEDPIIMTTEEMREFESSLNLPETESKNDKVKPVVSTADLQSHEALREKYVYPSEHFSKKAYNDMLEYDRKERKRLQEFWDTAGRSEQSKPKCPTCGSENLSRISGIGTISIFGNFGITNGDAGKTFKCNNCGYRW